MNFGPTDLLILLMLLFSLGGVFGPLFLVLILFFAFIAVA
jgi:hypothetical protein